MLKFQESYTVEAEILSERRDILCSIRGLIRLVSVIFAWIPHIPRIKYANCVKKIKSIGWGIKSHSFAEYLQWLMSTAVAELLTKFKLFQKKIRFYFLLQTLNKREKGKSCRSGDGIIG